MITVYNTTLDDIFIYDTGFTISAMGQHTVANNEYSRWAYSQEVKEHINAGRLLVSVSLNKYAEINANDEVSTTSSSYVQISQASITPDPGVFLVVFSCNLATTGVNGAGDIALFANNNIIVNTVRTINDSTSVLGLITLSTNFGATPAMTMCTYSFDGNTTISARFKRNNGNSIVVKERTLFLLKLTDV